MKVRDRAGKSYSTPWQGMFEIDADTPEDAIKRIANGEVNLPTASDDPRGVWTLEHSVIENEAHFPA